MNDPLVIALTTSGVGMGLLFLALAVLYGLMYLMTALTGEREQQTEEKPTTSPSTEKRRAAAIGAALARAAAEMEATPATENSLSPWQAYHRHRLLERHPSPPGRHRP